MSDSSRTAWSVGDDFRDFLPVPLQLKNPNPVIINIAGDLKDLSIMMPKETEITVGGEMDNSSFSGQNLHANDTTFLHVAGRIWNRNDFTLATASLTLPAPRF